MLRDGHFKVDGLPKAMHVSRSSSATCFAIVETEHDGKADAKLQVDGDKGKHDGKADAKLNPELGIPAGSRHACREKSLRDGKADGLILEPSIEKHMNSNVRICIYM